MMCVCFLQIPAEEVEKLAKKKVSPCSEFSETMATFSYSPRAIPDTKTAEVRAILCMYVYICTST